MGVAATLPEFREWTFFLTQLASKVDDSNFVQNYFGVRSIFCDKK